MRRPLVTIRLTKLFLWAEAARFQTYPEIMTKLDPHHIYSGTQEVAKAVAGSRDAGGRNASRDEVALNLPGWGPSRHGDSVLRGIGLLEQHNGGYVVSATGKRLARLFEDESGQGSWQTELAQILLEREPRTRTIIGFLNREGATLTFAKGGWFTGAYKEVLLENEDEKWTPFAATSSADPDLQVLLNRAGKWALGHWIESVQPEEAEEVQFTGTTKRQLSMNGLGSALRGPFELFLHLGLLSESDGVVTWEHQRASELFPADLIDDMGGQYIAPRESRPDLVVRLIGELSADDGYVVASELRDALHREGVQSPDKEIATLIEGGVIRLEAYDYGQSRHGHGLFDDPKKQLVKFRVLAVSTQTAKQS